MSTSSSLSFVAAYPSLREHLAQLQWLDQNRYPGGSDPVRFCRLLCCLLQSGARCEGTIYYQLRKEDGAQAPMTTTNAWVCITQRITHAAEAAYAKWIKQPMQLEQLLTMQKILGVMHCVVENEQTTEQMRMSQLRLRAASLFLAVVARTEKTFDLAPGWLTMAHRVLRHQSDAPDLPWQQLQSVCRADRLRYHGDWTAAAAEFNSARAQFGWKPDEDRAVFMKNVAVFVSSYKAPPEADVVSLEESPVNLKGLPVDKEHSFAKV